MTFLEAPKAKSLKVTKDRLIVRLKDGRILIVPTIWYPRLHFASIEQKKRYEILGDGEIIHWPLLDEDISIEGMLAGRKSGESPNSFERWRKGLVAAPNS